MAVLSDVLPNESRLSCGAELEGSQGKFYHTARKTFSGSIGHGRRQLQALLGCAPQVIARVLPFREAQGALTLAAPGTGTRMPRGPMLGTDQARHTGAQGDFHVEAP